MIAYSKKLVRIAEAWNGETPDSTRIDLIRLFQQPAPIQNMLCREFYTILLDLKEEPDALLSKVKKETRYEINRASTKDNLTHEYLNAKQRDVFDEFCNYYDRFALQKGQPVINRRWLRLMAETENLIVSRVRETTGESLVWHLYYRSGERVTLLHSASLFRNSNSSRYRNRVGRANRFLHWQDFLNFRAAGVSLYDFGGWYEGDKDEQRLRINKFKEEFGGEIVKNYICELGITFKGRMFLLIRKLLIGNAI
ncbi:MAG: hypothetical protein DMF68_08180 [Acidobacteria bacterium]|nr:MAG: hypothetical protein DMF68_08180 [Acidobacteriota bacterium]